MAADSHKELQQRVTFGNWLRKDIQYSQFQNYELTYAHFVRFPTPFSWGSWQPGSSPGNNKWTFFKSFWRDANIFLFSNILSKLNLFSSNIDYFAPAIKNNIIISRIVGSKTLHETIHQILAFIANENNQELLLKQLFKLHNNNIQLCYPKQHNTLKMKHLYIDDNNTGHKKVPRKFHFAKFTKSCNFNIKNTLFGQKTNKLLKCQIIVSQIRVKLLTSWWRDKISWYYLNIILTQMISPIFYYFPSILYLSYIFALNEMIR